MINSDSAVYKLAISFVDKCGRGGWEGKGGGGEGTQMKARGGEGGGGKRGQRQAERQRHK